MKAIRMNEFGGAEVLNLEDIERPVPAADEVLVKVFASGVNPVDLVIRDGSNEGFKSFLKLPMTLGWDASGTVEAWGSDVTGFKKGDAVYGVPDFPGDGSYAEYVAAKANQFALKPASLGFNDAAGVPLAALTAWTGMFAHGKLQSGQRILITGASGVVGSFAVQFAKAKGAYAIGLASGGNLDYVKRLGADEVIDYTSQPFEEVLHDIDVVLEASSLRDNSERLKFIQVLKPGGILVSVNTDFAFDDEVKDALAKKGMQGEMSPNQPRKDWLEEIAQLIDDGKVKVLTRKVFPLEEVAEAHRETQRRHVVGKVVLEVRKED